MRYKITIAYDGKNYRGWQVQPGKTTVQGEVEAALKKLTGENVKISASGRTDEGVSALGQVAHFDLSKEFNANRIASGINHFLPFDIRVVNGQTVSEDFNARRSAKKKTYVYFMYRALTDNPLLNNMHRLEKDVDFSSMQAAAELMCGKHDFEQFRCVGSSAKTTVRTVYSCEVSKKDSVYGQEVMELQVCADGFLYKMVRIIAGAVIRVGYGDLTLNDIRDYLNLKPYTKYAAPPHGLCLKSVEYD